MSRILGSSRWHLGLMISASCAFAFVAACSSSSGSGFSSGGSSGEGSSGFGSSGFGGSSGSSGTACTPDPGNFEVPGNNCDDDGDGQVDNVPNCDMSGLRADGNAEQFAKAMGLCKKSDGTSWGLISAEFSRAVGATQPTNDAQHGILAKFGNSIKPREGSMLGVLSSGFGREYNGLSGTTSFNRGMSPLGGTAIGQPMQTAGFQPVAGTVPNGFPKTKSGCVQLANDVYDTVVLRLKIKVPNNAKGVSFDFNFFTSEWPKYLCTRFNDSFIAYLTSKKVAGGADNISFDSQKNAVSVNAGFFDRCTPNVETGCCTSAEVAGCGDNNRATSVCPGGPGELDGTGYGRVSRASASAEDREAYCKDSSTGGGATGWLQTQAPVEPGETITLEFGIWDTGDQLLDSSVLLDNFGWVPGEVVTSTTRPK